MRNILAISKWLWWLGTPQSPVPVLGVAAVAMLACQLAIPIWDVDIFWQLKLGHLTRQHGLPDREPLLANSDDRLSSLYWIGQVVYSIIFDIGGWCLLRVSDAVIWFGGFFLVARQAARRIGNDWPAVAALAVGFVAALPFASLRMQSFGVLGFGLVVAYASRVRSPRTFILATAVMVLWQNLHPSVIVAAVYLGARAVGVAWAAWRVNAECRSLVFVAVLAAVATLATPDGAGIYAVSRYNAEISKEQRQITEWQPMWGCGFWNNGRDVAWAAFAVTLVILGITAVVRRSAIAACDLVPLAAFTIMTLYCHRFVLFWGVAVVAVLAPCLASWVNVRALEAPGKSAIRRGVLLMAAVFGIGVPLARTPVHFGYYFPFDAVSALEKVPFRGVIFNDYFWGGVLSFHGHPQWQPTHDGRYYRLSRGEWEWYDAAVAGRVPVKAIVEKYHPAAFLLRKDYDDGLINRLHRDPDWRMEFDDEQSVLFTRHP